jgi:hypothetical protein
MRILLIVLTCFISSAIFAKEPNAYPVSRIPENLKEGMYAVVRESEKRVNIHSISSNSYYERVVITILNSKGSNYAKRAIGYDKNSTVKFFKGTLYDASGKEIKKTKSSDILDYSAYDGVSLYSDNRIKQISLTHGSYPYTVEFEYQIDEKILYGLPSFYKWKDDEVSIQKQTFTIQYPLSIKPNYKLNNIEQPKLQTVDGKESMTWAYENVIPLKNEPFSPTPSQTIPNVVFAPSEFDYAGYRGNMNSWESFGVWRTSLLKGRDILPQSTTDRVKDMTKDLHTISEKTQILYEYLQSKSRYVNIAENIGGIQPNSASDVDKYGYGDCKALSNYMIAMLKVVGIKGIYAVIKAGDGENYMDESFVSHQSNHAIVAVPNGADTIWLECTSQTAPFNYQGTFTGDRKALLVLEVGSKLVNTHRYTAEQNTQTRISDVHIQANGDATAKVRTIYAGTQYEYNGLDYKLTTPGPEQKKWIENNTHIPVFDIVNYNMVNHKRAIPAAVVTLDLSLRKYASVTGKRIFLTPNLMNRNTFIPKKLENRRTDIVIYHTYTEFDTIRYHLPEDIYPEHLPEPTIITSDFGEYETSYSIEQGNVVYYRRFKQNKGTFPPEKYNEMIDFYQKITKADQAKIVFLTKT